MTWKTKLITAILAIVAMLHLINLYALPQKQEVVLKLIVTAMDSWHYDPPKLDNELSRKVFDQYLKRLDYAKRFFLQEDIDYLRKYDTAIDNQIRTNSFEFYNDVNRIFDTRLAETEAAMMAALDAPFDYMRRDSLETEYDKMQFPASQEEKEKQLQMWAQYQTEVRYIDMVGIHNAKVDSTHADSLAYVLDGMPVDSLEVKARQAIEKRMRNYFRRLREQSEEERLALFINSFLSVYDPHTTYMPPLEKEDFDIDMTGQYDGIGANLTEEDGYIKVTNIIPGSPAARGGELEVGDLFLKVAQDVEEPVDLVDMPLREAVKLIRGKRDTIVRLTVQKADKSIKEISITRGVVVMEETYARAAVIEEDGKKFAYVQLPKFYRDFNNAMNRNATDDVRAAIEKLPPVDGMVLDLRNNSGGALPDAVDIAGLFIESGPVVQVRSSSDKREIDYDNDPAVYYDGPLVVMVNKLSASASEILAAALQDYNRAVIVGSEQTFGKGTVQTFVDLDRMVNSRLDAIKPLGSLKFTYQKYYRANGQSTQFKGVHSDILLPDSYGHVEIGEQELDNPLPWDTIESADPGDYHLTQKLIHKLAKKSEKRVKNNSAMQKVAQRVERLGEFRAQTRQPLNLEQLVVEYTSDREDIDQLRDLLKEQVLNDIELIEYAATPTDSSALARYEERQETWLKGLKKDVFVQEATRILQDMR
jgi:carboxyl-terminal processing protease